MPLFLAMIGILLGTAFLFVVIWVDARLANWLSVAPDWGNTEAVCAIVLPLAVHRNARRTLADRIMAFPHRYRL